MNNPLEEAGETAAARVTTIFASSRKALVIGESLPSKYIECSMVLE